MARDRSNVTEIAKVEPNLPNSLAASAVHRRAGSKSYVHIAREADGWQKEGWKFYHSVGEFRYACDWVGSMLSKAVLFATEEKNGTKKPLTNGDVARILDELGGDADGKAEILRQIGIHFTVAGDCYLIAWADPDYEEDMWEVVASTELRRPTSPEGTYTINGIELRGVKAKDVLEIYLLRPDPQKPREPMSPTRAVLPVLAEIVKLTEHVSAQVESRLASAGILLVPSEIVLPEKRDDDGTPIRHANNAEALSRMIEDVASTAIVNRDDASALVPIVITAPATAIAAIKHLTFWSELDRQAIELRNEAIRRLALGMDMPPEVLQGLSDSNHWSAWQADESAIKAHTEPLLKIVTTKLAREYLRPALADERGVDLRDVRAYSIGADTAEMRLRPNRSKEAFELYDRGELNGEALRRETGFTEEDRMDEKELAQWYTRKVAGGSTTPELVAGALEALGVNLTNVRQSEEEGETQEGRPAPSLVEHPVLDIPDQERSVRRKRARDNGDVPSAQAASYTIAMEQAVFRALERAGNRMRNRIGGKTTGVSAANTYLTFASKPADLDNFLADAWGENVNTIASHMGVEAERLTAILDGYCRTLLMTQAPHDFEAFAAHVERALSEEKVSA